MQTPMDQVSAALRMYYSGMSLDGIQGQLKQQYNNNVAESTIYYWVTRFTKEAVIRSESYHPEVGDVWIADETGIDVHGNKRDLWFWDIIDAKSRFLLASHISNTRTTEDAKMLIQKAVLKAGKYPRVIITDKLRAYIDGIDLSIGLDKVQHISSKPFTTENSTNKIERFHSTFKDRIKVVRAYKNLEAAELITQGWLIHYNFFKEHPALDNTPPAVKMNISIPFINWNDIVVQSQQPLPTVSDTFTSFFNKPITQEQLKRQKQHVRVNQNVKQHRANQSISSIKSIR
jgi:putative transposase